MLDAGANVNISKAAGQQWNPSIAIDPTNTARLFSIAEQAGGSSFAAYSTDSGTTWTAISSIQGVSPKAAFDSFGNLFVATDLNGAPRVYVSVNAGQTFGQIFGPSGPGYGRPALATGPGSVWLSVRGPAGNVLAAGAQVNGLANVGTFSAFQAIPNSTGGDIPAVAIGPTGQVLVAYQSPGAGSRRSTILTGLDADGLGGGGFGNPNLVTPINVGGFRKIPAQNTAGIDSAISLSWDRSTGPFSGRVYLAYTDASSATTSDTNIFTRYSTNSGVNWSNAKRVNDDTGASSQFNPVVAVDQTSGHVGLAWLDARRDKGLGGPGDTNGIPNDDVQTFATISYDGSFLYVANRQVSDKADASNSKASGNPADYGRYLGLAFHGGRFHPAWADNSPALPGNPALPALDLATVRVEAYPNAVTTEHADGFAVDYDGGWILKVRDRDNDIAYDPNEVALYGAPHAKVAQPGDPNYAFIGAGAGNPVWILPQTQDPNLLFLGLSSQETPGNPFAAYFNSDPRLGFTAPWIQLALLDVRGPGLFSAWQTGSFGDVTVWIATSDGLSSSDVLYSLPGSHFHFNWGFTQPGTYEVDFQASAYFEYPNNQTFSAVTTYTFVVDELDDGQAIAPLPPPPDREPAASRTNSSSVLGKDQSIEPISADGANPLPASKRDSMESPYVRRRAMKKAAIDLFAQEEVTLD
jgi:surface-anchored protein